MKLVKDPIDDAEWADPDNRFLDSLYFIRRDSRPFVPKRGCDELLGATVNFARPAGLADVDECAG